MNYLRSFEHPEPEKPELSSGGYVMAWFTLFYESTPFLENVTRAIFELCEGCDLFIHTKL